MAKSVSFFTLPIYTRIFSPSDYGTIEMLTVISSFIGAILGMGMDSAQSMYFFKNKEKGKEEQAIVVSSILQWRLIFGAIIVVTATLLGPFFNAFFFNGSLGIEFFLVAFLSTLFGQLLSQSASVMRLLYRPFSFISLTLAQSIFGALMILFFVLVYEQGILGYFIGTSIASFIVAIIGWYYTRDYLRFNRLHTDWWPQLLRFGAPLVPSGLAMYFMSTADRWFIQFYHGPEQLGLFAVAAKISMIMVFGVEVFRKAWWPVAMDAMHSKDGPETFRLIAKIYFGIGCAATFLLSLLSPTLTSLFADIEFYLAWQIVGILAWKAFLYGFYLIASAGIWKREKTHLSLYITGVAALFGIFLNYFCVPEFGSTGAAFATVVTYFLWISVTIVVSEKLWPLGLNLFFFLLTFLTSIGVSLWLNLIKPGSFNFFDITLICLVMVISLFSPIKDLYRRVTYS
jgi:O-antigen/teichoic acid export membrane protein